MVSLVLADSASVPEVLVGFVRPSRLPACRPPAERSGFSPFRGNQISARSARMSTVAVRFQFVSDQAATRDPVHLSASFSL